MKKVVLTTVTHNGNSLSLTSLENMQIAEEQSNLYIFDEYPQFAFSFYGKLPKTLTDEFIGNAYFAINNKYYLLSNINNSNIKKRCDVNKIIQLIENRNNNDEPLLIVDAWKKKLLTKENYEIFISNYTSWRNSNIKI